MRLPEIMPAWIGRSRIEAARLAENLKCEQVVETMIRELSKNHAWTAADDHAPPDSEKAAVIANLQECARRIRARRSPSRNSQRLI